MLRYIHFLIGFLFMISLGACASKEYSMEFANDFNSGASQYEFLARNYFLRKKMSSEDSALFYGKYNIWKKSFYKKYGEKMWNDYCETVIRGFGKTDDDALNDLLLNGKPS